MKKSVKIAVWVAVPVVLLLLVAMAVDIYANQIVTKIVRQALDRQIAQMEDGQTVSYGHLSIDVFTGQVCIKEVKYASQEVEAQVDRLEVKDVDVKAIVKSYLHRADTLMAEEVNICLLNTNVAQSNSRLTLALDSVAVTLRDFGYCISDSAICYSDSCYGLALSGVEFHSADGFTRATVASFCTTDAGPLEMRQMRVWNAVDKTKFAEAKGNIPVVWTDTRVRSIVTSPVNIFHLAAEKKIDIKKVNVAASSAVVYKDMRYKAKEPCPMPQEMLKALPIPVNIGHVHLSLAKLDFSLVTSQLACGNMGMNQIVVDLTNVCNKARYPVHTHVTGQMAQGGTCDVTLALNMNNACSFNGSLTTRDVQASGFDDLLKPLFGATMRANIKAITTTFTGDKTSANGTFCMEYSGLRLQAYKNSPIKIISRGAGAINFFAPLVIPAANPLNAKNEPRSYNIHFDRDVMQGFDVYLVTGIAMGAKATLLPGLHVKDRIKG